MKVANTVARSGDDGKRMGFAVSFDLDSEA